jgi:uncharacterized protein DUF3352
VKRFIAALRARFTLRRVALAIALVAAFFGVLALLDNDEPNSPPVDHAASLVPQQALVYAHLSVERDSSQWENASRLARGFPMLVEQRDRFLRSVTARGGKLDLEREIYPWLGN